MGQLDTTYYATNVKNQMMALMANENLNGLSEREIYETMLAAAIASENPTVANNMECFVREYIDEETILNAKLSSPFVDLQGHHKHLFHIGDGIIVQRDDSDWMKVIERQNKGDYVFLTYFLAALYIENVEYYNNLRDELLAEKSVDPTTINSAIKIATVIDTIVKAKGNVDQHTTKVLIVNDDNYVLTLVRNILKNTGKMNIVTVNDGVDGIKIGKIYKPDLVILDVLMLDMPSMMLQKGLNKMLNYKI